MTKQRPAVDYLCGAEFDVALLQETRDPRTWTKTDWSCVAWNPKRGSAGPTAYGSAVIARSLELEPYQPDETFPWLQELAGSVAIARCRHSPTWLASVHTSDRQVPSDLLDRHPWDQAPLATPNRSVWEQDLIPFELHRLFGGQSFLWGGDLNSAEVMDERGFLGGNRKLRETWREAGSHDLRLRFFADEQQTFFRRDRRAYQLDHVFADAETEARVADWRVDPTPALGESPSSDHAPILIELN